jgi:hypothetical protein
VVGFEIDSCVGCGGLSIYVYFEMWGFSVYVSIYFVCRVEFYVAVYLVYVGFNEFWLYLIGVLYD